MTQCAPIFDNLPKAIEETTPQTMEKYDQGHGCILYRTTIPAGPAGLLEAAAVHDFGFVFLDGKRIGVLDRRSGIYKLLLPERKKPATLDILVEAVGHVNFGLEVHDRKGIQAPVKLGGTELTGWKIFSLPLDDKMLAGLKYAKPASGSNMPAFWRAVVNIKTPGDTFLDLRSWGKGVVWVNGHCLARYWDIGPTQTAYTPGCWLRAGENEIVILDLTGPEKPEIAGLEKPILDDLHPEKDFAKSRRPVVKLQLDSAKPVLTAQFAPGGNSQEVKLPVPATGRYFCLESLSAFDGQPFAAIAELNLLDGDGKALSHEGWTIAYVDSEERDKEDGTAENAIDGQTANFWHTQWSAAQPPQPHQLVLDLGKAQTISGLQYVPRQSEGAGRIKDYRILCRGQPDSKIVSCTQIEIGFLHWSPLPFCWLEILCSAQSEFHPGEVWSDTDGKPIQAHGGGILVHSNVYYWYGEDRTPGIRSSVSCYSSTNLLWNWKREGVALWQTNVPHYYGSPTFVERPKVIFNPRTKKFVMWLHAEQPGYLYACAGTAVSDMPAGPFVFLKTFRPITNDFGFPDSEPIAQKQYGGTFRDMNLFVDDDGKAYVFYAADDNWTMYVTRLNDEFTGPETPAVEGKTFARILVRSHREAPALFKWHGKYFLITSACTGAGRRTRRTMPWQTASLARGKLSPTPAQEPTPTRRSAGKARSCCPAPGRPGQFHFHGRPLESAGPARFPLHLAAVHDGKPIGAFTIPWRERLGFWDFWRQNMKGLTAGLGYSF